MPSLYGHQMIMHTPNHESAATRLRSHQTRTFRLNFQDRSMWFLGNENITLAYDPITWSGDEQAPYGKYFGIAPPYTVSNS